MVVSRGGGGNGPWWSRKKFPGGKTLLGDTKKSGGKKKSRGKRSGKRGDSTGVHSVLREKVKAQLKGKDINPLKNAKSENGDAISAKKKLVTGLRVSKVEKLLFKRRI